MKVIKYKDKDENWQDLYQRYKLEVVEEPEFVDLGLPSGTLWATCNLGAENPYEVGQFFQWNCIEPKNQEEARIFNYMPREDRLKQYKWYNNESNEYFCDLDNKNIKEENDAAYILSNGEQRIPNDSQWWELEFNTTYSFVNNYLNSGVDGLLLTSKINSNTLFLPATNINTYNSSQYTCRSVYYNKGDLLYIPRFSDTYRDFADDSGSGNEGMYYAIRPVKYKS